MNTRNNGFTLIELLVAMAVLALVLTYVISSFGGMFDRQRLQAGAEDFYSKLLLARSEAINRNGDIFVSISSGADWCYGVDDTAVCDCGTANDCQVDGSNKVTSSLDYKGIKLSSASISTIVYDPRRGIPEDTSGNILSPSTFSFLSSGGDTLAVQLSPVGRLRLCTTSSFKGYPSC